MKSLTYHITLDNNHFWEYAERHRFGKEDMPTLSQDSVFFNELWEIKNMWRVYCESMLSATTRRDEVASAYSIPVEKLRIYRRTVEIKAVG